MIRVRNLTKYYNKRLALDNISFSVEKGEIVGFLGPNAAGKTTTMRILTGFLAPTRGEAWIADKSVLSDSLAARQHIGYFAESVPLYTDMTVRSYLEFWAKLRGLEKERIKKRVNDVVETCHLEEYRDVYIGKLSKGFRQRVGVGQAIIHEPDVLILDEPTVGIDPIQVAMTRQLIKELGETSTILLSTHILPEVSMTCDRVIIIHEGKIIAEDKIENLSSMVGTSKRIRLEVQGPADEVTKSLRQIRGITSVKMADERHHVAEYPATQDLRSKITDAVVKGGWTILSMESLEMSLEDVFLKLTTEEDEEE
ncbi:MAG: ATP-binding cassette domain-containing protein [Dehalococcoidales bacterium]|nr:MAG: ATP-binding cassette domain-containing protein [Dehalococcoidales bacterium]